MSDESTDSLLPDRERHKALGRQLREMARSAPSAYARKELLRLAGRFEYRAQYLGRYKE
jgi:hypothetical protein